MMSCLKKHIDDETVEGSHVFVSVSFTVEDFKGRDFYLEDKPTTKNKTQTDVALVL